MQITVFGASGNVGRQAVAIALGNGYRVNVFVHNRKPFKDTKKLKVFSGDIGDAVAVAAALKGSDAVISALGSWHTKDKKTLTVGMRTILPAMKEQGIKRIVSLTGTAALYSQDKTTILDKLSHFLLKRAAPKILKDGEAHLKLLEASNLEWTCLRSPRMTNGISKTYSLGTKLSPPWATVSRAAVAQSLVDQVEATNFIRKAPVIYHKHQRKSK